MHRSRSGGIHLVYTRNILAVRGLPWPNWSVLVHVTFVVLVLQGAFFIENKQRSEHCPLASNTPEFAVLT